MRTFKEYLEESIILSETRIGDLVKLKKPIDGHDYAHIKGFNMQKGAGFTHKGHLQGKVDTLSATLKKSPLNKADYGSDTKLKTTDYDTVRDQMVEIGNWKSKKYSPGEKVKVHANRDHNEGEFVSHDRISGNHIIKVGGKNTYMHSSNVSKLNEEKDEIV